MILKDIQQKATRVIESLSSDIQIISQPWKIDEGVFIAEDNGRYKIDVAFGNLTLEQKTVIEKSLKKQLNNLSFYVNFRSPKSQMSAPKSVKKADPYGLTRKPVKIPGVKHIVVVASGKGGVGKSTVSCNIAAALSSIGQRVGYLDADIYGPSGGLMFGLTAPPKVTSEDKLVPQEAHGVKVASFGTLTDPDAPAIWRGPMIARAFEQLCFQVDWGELDYLIIDLPPGTGDIQLTMLEKLAVNSAIIVSTPQDMALIDARKAVTMFKKLGLKILGLVENMKTHICSNCGHEEELFGSNTQSILESHDISLLGSIPLCINVRIGADTGSPVSLTEETSAKVFIEIAKLVHEKS